MSNKEGVSVLAKKREREDTSDNLIEGDNEKKEVAIMDGDSHSNLSKCLLITNISRSCNHSELQNLMNQTGKVVRFYVDSVKSSCFVEYENTEQAKVTRRELSGKVWPEGGNVMNVDFIEGIEAMFKIREVDKSNVTNVSNVTKVSNVPNVSNPSTAKQLENKRIKTNNEEQTKNLDSLFKKTKTKPYIYYLPLKDEEVEIKLKQQ